mgnify:CR=1 FL=1
MNLVLGLLWLLLSLPALARPNIVYILADDLGWTDLGCMGSRYYETPHIDRLAKEGMLFHDAHHMGSWSGAVCRPSRTMIMTGKTVWRIPGAGGVDARVGQLNLDFDVAEVQRSRVHSEVTRIGYHYIAGTAEAYRHIR